MEQHALVTLTVGIGVHDLTPAALAHEHASEFKLATQALITREFGAGKLEEMSEPSSEDVGEGGYSDMLRIANRHLVEATVPMSAGRVVRHGCTFFPPNEWRIWGQISVHKKGLPLLTREAAVEYDQARQQGGADPIEEGLMNELSALPLVLQIEWRRTL